MTAGSFWPLQDRAWPRFHPSRRSEWSGWRWAVPPSLSSGTRLGQVLGAGFAGAGAVWASPGSPPVGWQWGECPHGACVGVLLHACPCWCVPVHVRTREPLGQGRVCQEQHVHAHASQAGEGRSSPCFKQAENKPLDLWLIFIGWVCVIAMLIVLERKRAVECKPWVRL